MVERRGIIAERSQGAGQNRRKTGKKELKSSKKPGEKKAQTDGGSGSNQALKNFSKNFLTS